MNEQPTSIVYSGEPTNEVYLARDGTTFRLCSKDDSDLVASVRLATTVVNGDTILIPPFSMTLP